jgi:hypothetical protein
MSRIERLDGHVQNYVWGKRGRESEVARLYVAGHPDAGGISPAATYAEACFFQIFCYLYYH